MNTKEYIASGILEAYVLGDVTAREREEVERYAREYPEIAEELRRAEMTQEAFLQKMRLEPPPEIREKLLAGPARKGKTRSVAAAARSNPWRWVAAAAIFLAVVTGGLAVIFYNNWQKARVELNQLAMQNQQVAENYSQVLRQLEQIQGDLSIITDPSYARINLSRPDAQSAAAMVFWNRETQEVYLKSLSLQQLTQDQQYQLWALIDGQPVDAGVFDAGSDGILRMKNIAEADAFAVTIEPHGGSEHPTLSALQVSGEIL